MIEIFKKKGSSSKLRLARCALRALAMTLAIIALAGRIDAQSQSLQEKVTDCAKKMRVKTISKCLEKADKNPDDFKSELRFCTFKEEEMPSIYSSCKALADAIPTVNKNKEADSKLRQYSESCIGRYKIFKPTKNQEENLKKELEEIITELTNSIETKPNPPQPDLNPPSDPTPAEDWQLDIDRALARSVDAKDSLVALESLFVTYKNIPNASKLLSGLILKELESLAKDPKIADPKKIAALQPFQNNKQFGDQVNKISDDLIAGINLSNPETTEYQEENAQPNEDATQPTIIAPPTELRQGPSPIARAKQALNNASNLQDSLIILRRSAIQGEKLVSTLLETLDQKMFTAIANALIAENDSLALRRELDYKELFPKGKYINNVENLLNGHKDSLVPENDQQAWDFALRAEGPPDKRMQAFNTYLNGFGNSGFYREACQDSIQSLVLQIDLSREIKQSEDILRLGELAGKAEMKGWTASATEADQIAWNYAQKGSKEWRQYQSAFDGQEGRYLGKWFGQELPRPAFPWWLYIPIIAGLLGGLGYFLFWCRKTNRKKKIPVPSTQEEPVNIVEADLPPAVGTAIQQEEDKSEEVTQLVEIPPQEKAWNQAYAQNTLQSFYSFLEQYPGDPRGRNKIDQIIQEEIRARDPKSLEHLVNQFPNAYFLPLIQPLLKRLQDSAFFSPEPHPNGYFDRFRLQKDQAGCLFQLSISEDEASGTFVLLDDEDVVKTIINNDFANLSRACEFVNYHRHDNGQPKTRVAVEPGSISLIDRKWVINRKCSVEFK